MDAQAKGEADGHAEEVSGEARDNPLGTPENRSQDEERFDQMASVGAGLNGIPNLPKELIDEIFLNILPPYMRSVCCFVCKDWNNYINRSPSPKSLFCEFAIEAAIAGDLKMLKWGVSQGCPWNRDDVFISGSRSGNIDLLQWVLDNGGQWTAYGFEGAAGHGRVETLKWLREEGIRRFQVDFFTSNETADVFPTNSQPGLLSALSWIVNTACSVMILTPPLARQVMCLAAAREGQVHVLQWLQTQGVDAVGMSVTAKQAAESGRVSVLEWLRDNGRKISSKLYKHAAKGGQIEIFEWLLKHQCVPPLEEACCENAVEGGSLEAVKWLREHAGCPLSVECCATAAKRGDLKLLQSLREMGCPWSEECCARAAANGDLNMLQALREMGCPCGESASSSAVRMDCLEVFLWLRDAGYPLEVRQAKGEIEAWLRNNDHTLWLTTRLAEREESDRIFQQLRENLAVFKDKRKAQISEPTPIEEESSSSPAPPSSSEDEKKDAEPAEEEASPSADDVKDLPDWVSPKMRDWIASKRKRKEAMQTRTATPPPTIMSPPNPATTTTISLPPSTPKPTSSGTSLYKWLLVFFFVVLIIRNWANYDPSYPYESA